MNLILTRIRKPLILNAALLLGLLPVLPVGATVLDDFNAAERVGWQDADPANLPVAVLGQKGGIQANGVFTYNLNPIGQAYFINSTKLSPEFELKEGRTIEFRVDMVSGRGTDSYAVLGFMPKANGPNALAGYGIAKSETDVLITKGINQYFIDDDTTPVKNTNVTLVLNLTARGGNVYITGQVLDKEANNSVIWERRFVDTPAADVLGTGTENPTTPYITVGNFVLYLYADGGQDPAGYQVVYDNAKYFVTDTTLTDDFNAAERSGWQDADPANLPIAVLGQKGGVQGGGVFTYNLNPIGQAYFVSSTKISKAFVLTEGTRHEFSVDMISGRGTDSYAVLGFMPQVPGPNALAGYGIAKSETDVLITKGINQYFIDDDTAPVDNTNVKLVLTLTVESGNVTIRGRVLDNDNNGAVLWERTFVDTPAADVLGTGTENPTTVYTNVVGNAVLYLYGDGGQDPAGYQVIYDNLAVAEPPSVANPAPIISEVLPLTGAAFLSAPVTVSFKASDDKPLPDSGISVALNDGLQTTVYTSANGVTLSGQTTNRTVTLTTGTGVNSNYVATIVVTDADSASSTNVFYFDTFTAVNPLIEAEDYNFANGQYLNDPVPYPEGVGGPDTYSMQQGFEGVDFHDTRTTPNAEDTKYRLLDPVRMRQTLDQPRAKYDAIMGIYGYDIGDIESDEWLNYTHDFAAGTYEVYLRQSIVTLPEGKSDLEKVTGDPTQPNQTVSPLGSFLGKTTGYSFRNVPLTDGSGLTKLALSLSGKTTLRLRQVTADGAGARFQNYLVFVPVEASGLQRPIITSLEPSPGSLVTTVSPVIRASILNRDTTIDTTTVKLEVEGQVVPATVTATPTGADVTYTLDPLPPNGPVQARITFKDNSGTESALPWQFTMAYNSLDPALRVAGTGKDRGFNVRVVQAQVGQTTDNSLDFAEALLRPNTTFLVQYETNVVAPVINFSQDGPGTANGRFPDDELIPGLDIAYSSEDIAMEATTYLELPAGKYRLGATSDDGYKVQVVPSFTDRGAPPLAFHNGGPADESYDFVVTAGGLYRFRMVWYERGGGAHVEWWQGSFTGGANSLVNTNVAGVVKAYATVDVPPLFTSFKVQNGQLTITWTGAGVLKESSDLKTWTAVTPQPPSGTFTVNVGTGAGAKFYGLGQ
jgi:hypothetical protein